MSGSSGFSFTCLSVGEYAGVISLECVFKYSLSKALEHHLLTFLTKERVTVEMMVNKENMRLCKQLSALRNLFKKKKKML